SGGGVARDESHLAPALFGPPLAPVARQEMGERGEEKSAETPEFRPGSFEVAALDQVGEEFLRHVLGVGRGVAAASGERVKRWPVFLTQLLESGRRARRLAVARRQHDAPMRLGGEGTWPAG